MSDLSPLRPLLKDVQFGPDLKANVSAFLLIHGRADTLGHSARVASEAKRIAADYALDPAVAEVAGLLHDISAVIPDESRVQLAEHIGLTVLDAERQYPMIVHQRLSQAMAKELFGVCDEATLSAIGCHTTLKTDAGALDKAVFVADKVKWDQTGDPPYLTEILVALNESLDAASYCYLNYLFTRRERLRVVHPWAWAAYTQLSARVDRHA